MIKRILVADDSETIQKAISIALAPFDVELYVAASYVDTLGECRKHLPQLLIVDASLTGTDGTHDFQNLAAAAGGVPMLLLEGSYEPIDRSAFAAMGLNAFLKKPFDSQALLVQLRERLGVVFAKRPSSVRGVAAPQENQQLSVDFPISQASELNLALGTHDAMIPPAPPVFAASGASSRRGDIGLPPPPQANLGSKVPPPPPPVFRSNAAPYPTGHDHPAVSPEPSIAPVLAPQHMEEITASLGGTLGLEPTIQQEIEKQVQQAVTAYCDRHFRDVARQVLSEELRRLADERARHLVDN